MRNQDRDGVSKSDIALLLFLLWSVTFFAAFKKQTSRHIIMINQRKRLL